MYRITLLCTAHKPIGNCNSNELYKIIEKINPEILFEEIEFSRTIEYYRNQYLKTTETLAILKYLQNYRVIHVPVEMYNIPNSYIGNKDYIEKQMSKNDEYKNLLNEIYMNSMKKGFSFLNSTECSNLFEKVNLCTKDFIEISNDIILNKAYESDNFITEKREHEMLNNIYEFSSKHVFSNGVFIIGAEHRKSIIEKISKYEGEYKLKINWKY